MSNFFVDLLQYNFLQKAFVAGTLVCVIAPILGNFLVVQRQSALSDTIAHISLLGLVLGSLTSFSPIWVALLVSFVSSLLIVNLQDRIKSYKEVILSLLVALSLSLVSIITKLKGGLQTGITSYLFGSLNTISNWDINYLIIVSIITFVILKFNYRNLVLFCLDSDLAKIHGVNIFWIKNLLAIWSSLTITVGLQLFGSMLMTAIVVGPVIVAWNISKSFVGNLIWSVVVALFSFWCSQIISYSLVDLPTGSLTVVVICICWILLIAYNNYKKLFLR
jgi:zinc transport system permease protein